MDWKPITEEPKQKNRAVICLCLDKDGTISCVSDVWENWEAATTWGNSKFNGWAAYQYTHWAYLSAPKT